MPAKLATTASRGGLNDEKNTPVKKGRPANEAYVIQWDESKRMGLSLLFAKPLPCK